tara:strand:+ start:412 stop:1905 length:1494 start_codon:yes stop_codon:yes gene_type:complete
MTQLRRYQSIAIEDIKNEFVAKHKRVLLVAPTGSGKTVVACEMMSRVVYGGKKCLFVAHRRELVMQCSRKLHEFNVHHGVIMADRSPLPDADVQVASIQTFTARKDNEDFVRPHADLIILDEAHRSASTTFKQLIKMYPFAHIVGLTATPCRADGKGLGDIYNAMVQCGTVKNLTERGYLVPAKLFAPTLPDLKGLKTVAGDYEKKGLEKRMNVPKLVGDIVTHWIKYADQRPTVVFATSVAHSKYIAKMFNENGITAGHIDGSMPEIEREAQLSMLKRGQISVLCNCQVLTEGWDEPSVSCVVLARPTKSYGLYLQMVGRSLRPCDGKDDTLIIDHSGCVYQHGFPHDLPSWSLDTTKKAQRIQPQKQTPIEKQPFTCVNCDYVYELTVKEPECPNCNYKPEKQDKKLLIKQGRLVEVMRIRETKKEDKKSWFAELLYVSKQNGYLDGWASHVYRQKFKVWPAYTKVKPKMPSQEVLNYIKHLQIKRNARRRMSIK